MVFGDGDEDLPESERLFNRFTSGVDIIGYQFMHGVIGHSPTKLEHRGQSGALAESFCDIFGSLAKQWFLNQTVNQADWIIGDGLFTSNVKAQGIRSLKAPGTAYDDPILGKDPQPAHMRDYQDVDIDNGGVHINSGIPNHAFYVTAKELGGYAWEKAGRIWYVALRDRLHATSDFEHAAMCIIDTAARLYGLGSPEYEAVCKGWATVGISLERLLSLQPRSVPPPQPEPPRRGAISSLAEAILEKILATRRSSEYRHETATPPAPSRGKPQGSQTQAPTTSYDLSVAYPKLLSKGDSSPFIISIYPPQEREVLIAEIGPTLRERDLAEESYKTSLTADLTVDIELASPDLEFTNNKVKRVLGAGPNIIRILGKPKDNCQLGVCDVIITVSDAATGVEYFSREFRVVIVDYIVDHLSRPLAGKITAAAFAIASGATFILSFAGQIDQAFGLPSGAAAGFISVGLIRWFQSVFRKPSRTIHDRFEVYEA